MTDIPGNVGASPIQNIGAYGIEVKSFITEVEYLSLETFKIEKLTNTQCEFGYRDSIFKNKLKGKVIVKHVTFKLDRFSGEINDKYLTYSGIQEKMSNKEKTLNNLLMSVKEIRKAKLPTMDEYGSCGSTFKNKDISLTLYQQLEDKFPGLPKFNTEKENFVKIPVAYILEKLNWKNRRKGDVGTWMHHPLIVTNYGNATGKEIFNFIEDMQKDFKENTSLDLDLEINIIN